MRCVEQAPLWFWHCKTCARNGNGKPPAKVKPS